MIFVLIQKFLDISLKAGFIAQQTYKLNWSKSLIFEFSYRYEMTQHSLEGNVYKTCTINWNHLHKDLSETQHRENNPIKKQAIDTVTKENLDKPSSFICSSLTWGPHILEVMQLGNTSLVFSAIAEDNSSDVWIMMLTVA